jgi:hypothetical protein
LRVDHPDLRDQRLGVAEQQTRQRAVVLELVLQPIRPQPITVAGAQHHRPAGRASAAKECCDADHAFVARDREFGGRPTRCHLEPGNDAGGDEIQVSFAVPGIVDGPT